MRTDDVILLHLYKGGEHLGDLGGVEGGPQWIPDSDRSIAYILFLLIFKI